MTDVARFKEVLKGLGFEKLKEFKVTDHLFMPKGKDWDLSHQQMKVRVREDKTLLIYRVYEWVDKAKSDRMRMRKELKLDDALNILEAWNFEKRFSFSRSGTRYKRGDIVVSLENIDHLGHLIEIEAPSLQSLNGTIAELDSISDKIPESVPALIYNRMGE
ncbi:MAG: hypothetical protein V3V98_08820 [Thermoplasmata archaeon]